jgi:predicted RND superfamily exporter protein
MWTETVQTEALKLLLPAAIKVKMQDNIIKLMGPQSSFLEGFILADPLGLLSISAKKLSSLNISEGELSFNNGFLVSQDGKKALLLFDYTQNSFDRKAAVNIIKEVNSINKILPTSARAFAMGAARYTQENNDIVNKDVKKVLAISIFAMLAIFLIFFRQKNALFIYAVPLLVLMPAAVFTYFGFGALSGITLGFGSVLMGLAIDYSIYVYYAFLASSKQTGEKAVIRAISRPTMLSAFTSIISFVILYFCTILLFEQIAVFAVFGLIYALFIAFFVAPLFFKLQNKPVKDLTLPAAIKPLWAVILIVCILAGGLVSIKFLHLDSSLNSLNTVSKQFEEDRKVFDSLTGKEASEGSLLFVFGKDKDDALSESLALSKSAKQPLALSEILFSTVEQQKNIERWHKFWTAKKIKQVKNIIEESIRPFDIDKNIFNNFYNFLALATPPAASQVKNFDLTKIYNPFTEFEGQIAIVHIAPSAFKIPPNFTGKAALISPSIIQSELFHKVLNILAIVITIIFILDFVIVLAVLKSLKLALLSFIPVLCSISMIFILCAVFGIKINIFSLFAIPLIIGVCVDYAIFIIHKHTLSTTLYPSVAVGASALLSLAGFGSLIFASHKVLFAIGLTITVAIITASLISIYLLPGILKKVLKILPLFFLILLDGCISAGPKIVYDNKSLAAQNNIEASQVRQYYGEMGGSMLFNAVAANLDGAAGIDAAVRIITLSELGIKLLDMTITKDTVVIHFKINFLPKAAAKSLGLFYRDFYFNKSALIKEDLGSGKISYNDSNKKIVLWEQNEQDN